MFTDIPKYLRAMIFGLPKHGWYRVPMEWSDTNFHAVVTPPSGSAVYVSDATFNGDGSKIELELGYMLHGLHYVLDRFMCTYEGGQPTYPLHLSCPVDAVLTIRRISAGPTATAVFSARGYFLKGGSPSLQRINTKYEPGWTVAP